MKPVRTISKTVICLLLLGWMVLPSFTPDLRSDPDPQKSSAPVISFDKTIFDFGDVKKGEPAKHTFTFTNLGKKPLVIVRVNSSCGCTTPVWTKEPVKYKKTGSVTIKYNTNYAGKFRKKVTLISNAVNSPVTLVITGEVKAVIKKALTPNN